MRDAQARAELFGFRRDEALEDLLVPAHEVRWRSLHLDLAGALGVATGLGECLGTLDVVLGGLCDDAPFGVEAGTPCATCNLVELARVEAAHVAPVELGELGEKHGVDGDVDAHAERVGAADHGEQSLLGELLHQEPVARQHAGVVHAHSREDEALQGLAKGGGEAHPLDGFLQGLTLLLGGDAIARERLRALEGGLLREVHDVERRVTIAKRQLHGALERRLDELVRERHRPWCVEHLVDGASGVLLQRVGDVRDVAQGG